MKYLVAAVLLVLAGIALVLWNDSRFNVTIYECDDERELTLSPNFPGSVHWAEVYLGGWVEKGRVTVTGFPSYSSPGASRTFTTEDIVAASYVNELYGSAKLSLSADTQSQCHLRIVYRLKSTLSLLNPFW